MNNTDFIFVDSNDGLAAMVEACLEQPAIALDTEFIRTDTFYPKPALLQIYDRRQVYLVDPLTIDDFEPLKTLFSSPSTIKVMHSCSEDMDVFS
ncbi:MAG: ribonuclease D, partial [Pseudomonadales bacterium]